MTYYKMLTEDNEPVYGNGAWQTRKLMEYLEEGTSA